MMRRIIALLLVAVYSFGASTAMASEITPYYSMISSIHGACYIVSGTLDLSGTVTARVPTTLAKVTLTLQAHRNGKWKEAGVKKGSSPPRK